MEESKGKKNNVHVFILWSLLNIVCVNSNTDSSVFCPSGNKLEVIKFILTVSSFKDRQQLILPILVRSQYIEDLYGPPNILYTYYILLES